MARYPWAMTGREIARSTRRAQHGDQSAWTLSVRFVAAQSPRDRLSHVREAQHLRRLDHGNPQAHGAGTRKRGGRVAMRQMLVLVVTAAVPELV